MTDLSKEDRFGIYVLKLKDKKWKSFNINNSYLRL